MTSQASSPADPPLPAGCRAASQAMVVAGIGIDLAVVLVPLSIGLWVSGPALLRLLLVLLSIGLLLAQLVGHCLYGRAVGGMVLGLLTVDAEAGLPTGTARSLLPLMHLGSAAGATVLDTRQGPDPSRVTLDELDELVTQVQTPSTTPVPLPPSVPPQALQQTPPPPPEPDLRPSAAAPSQVSAPPRMTRRALRAQEREQERTRAQHELDFPNAGAPGPERLVG